MLVLHVYPSAPESWVLEAIRPERIAPVRIQSLSRPELAAARLAGGGVSAILLDLTGCGKTPDLASLEALRAHASDKPILIAASSDAPLSSGKERVIRVSESALLPALLREAAMRADRNPTAAGSARAADCRVIGFLGVKGGVGATTAALNIAALLAQSSDVVLAELRADRGALVRRLKCATRPGSLETLLAGPCDALDAPALEQVLWTVDSVPRLRVLSAPGPAADSTKLDGNDAARLICGLTACAPVVVLDLCWSHREALRAAVFEVSQLVLVAERTPFCLDIVRDAAAQLFAWGVSRNATSCLVINRSPAGVPPPIQQLESQLDIAVLGYLPPDPDVCGRSETLRKPIVTILPDGLLTQEFETLAYKLESRFNRNPGRPAPSLG